MVEVQIDQCERVSVDDIKPLDWSRLLLTMSDGHTMSRDPLDRQLVQISTAPTHSVARAFVSAECGIFKPL